MIPKKIHYTWFSGEAFPQRIQNCLDSWKKFLPDYEFILWDSKKIETLDNVFLKEALSVKKWAFASDYVRLFAVYSEGGIYLDTDVLLFKNFDAFLDVACFIGQENSFHMVGREVPAFLTSHCFGAEKENPFIGKCLEYYQDRHFILSSVDLPNELKYDMTLLPYIQAFIAKSDGWDWSYNTQNIFKNKDVSIFPAHYFDAAEKTQETVCQHLALGSWRESRVGQEPITLSYKIKWRVVSVLEKILKKLGYVIIKAK